MIILLLCYIKNFSGIRNELTEIISFLNVKKKNFFYIKKL